ncbi:hypothetical protein Smp_123250 [Schistosoma mansoni]|uniref:hypothetical protein n=1 Tax=Schistosoma mansoni TaxID=6183 RepID=UPI00022DC4E0|nr:hypothetical protein Smp_123250 [Schistosoma mansoni]|eukprot:XP_018652966.1 hypothetical protein Smp_123250 [Schistosoma mansoni]
MSEDQRITNRLTYPLSYLTNINEDTKGELVHSIIDFQQYHQKQEQSIHTCAVPINVCCVCSNESDPQLLHSNVQVLCATPGCKYSLFRLYECPACNQYTLYRSSIHSTVTSTSNVTGQTPQTLSSTPSNHFTNDLMKANEENSIPWGMTNIQTGQSIPRALIKGATINNPIKLPNDAAVLNDVTKYSIDSSTPTTRKSYSSTVNLDDLFDRSLDTTVNNNTTNNNDNNNSIGNINLMNRPLSAIGSRRHHSTSDGTGNISSSTIGCTTNTTTTTTSTTNTNTAYHHNVKSNTTWSNDSISKSRMTHWHGNNNVETKMKKVVNTKGNIFLQRHDFNVFMNLPNHKQNAYFIQMDDDSCTGNEDTRAFLLAQLTNHRVSEVYCLACQEILPIYDHFPVIDGIFFISPLCHRSNEGHRKGGGLRVTWHTNGIQNQSVQQQQQQTHRAHNTTTTNNNDNSSIGNYLVSSTNDYQSINEIALKLLAPLKIISPPPGCLGPRQQLNSTQHNMINTGALGGGGSSQGAGSNNSNNSIPSRFSTNHSSTRQCRYLHALCMNCMHSVNLVATSQVNDFKGIRCKICSKPWSGKLVDIRK